MSSPHLDQLLLAAQQSGLISAADLEELTAESLADKSPTKEALAAELVNRRLLSSYQAELLLSGRAVEAVVAERYRVLEKLGEGGMGAVYKAEDTRLDRLVAIKVLPPHMLQDPDAIARFQREARALAKLSHPNIVQAFDCGEDQGRHFLVMEFIDGPSLSRRLRNQRRIPPTIAADYIHQAALGLQHAHERGVIHRDIKPSNLLLAELTGAAPAPAEAPTACGGLGRIKILDLGLARFQQDQVAHPDVTREGTGMGTPDYMAPEQFRDAHHADARADIYALGCTLYHLLTGRVPFPGSSLSEKWKAHEEQEPPRLEEACPEAPAGLMLVAQRMMAKRPAERFQSAAETADALAPYIAGSSPSTARLRSTLSWQGGQLTTGRTARVPRRLWWLASCAALVLLVAFIAIAPSWPKPAGQGPLSDQSLTSDLVGKSSEGGTADTAANKSSVEPPKSKVITIPKGLTVAKDGTGQFSTISAALASVTPDMTIRVLDRAAYRELLSINSPSRHAGLVLEAVAGATLEVAQVGTAGITIQGVPRVTIRGLKFRAVAKVTMIAARNSAPGLVLEKLDMTPGTHNNYDGIALIGLQHTESDAPVVVRHCLLEQGQWGIAVQGLDGPLTTTLKYPDSKPCARVLIHDNNLATFANAIIAQGHLTHVHVVGNRIWGDAQLSAIQLENLHPDSEDVLVANNTVLECPTAIRLWDDRVKGRNVTVRNNLLLGSPRPSDMLFIDSGGSPSERKGPGDMSELAKGWQMDHNWREVKPPPRNDQYKPYWIPPGKGDVRRDEIAVLSRVASEKDFLRPAKDSPLAAGGAGGDLPGYVGAVPPEGQPQWDWQRTWQARTAGGPKPASGS